MRCKDCGHEISMNKMCERPIQAATDMLKHMAAHNASRAFAVVESVVRPEPEVILAVDSISALPCWAVDCFESPITQLSRLPLDYRVGPSTLLWDVLHKPTIQVQ